VLVFVDTNVFIYYLDKTDPKKYAAATLWLAELWQNSQGIVSYQVLQEFYWTGTRKWPEREAEIRAKIEDLFDWHPVVVNQQVIEMGWEVLGRYKISFWDALIVAAAKVASCRYLLTEDLQEGQEINEVKIINPFRYRPDEILSLE
jgi:predicted nucleic acid-binding protein